MTAKVKFLISTIIVVITTGVFSVSAQNLANGQEESETRSQEVSESDGVPVLIKHLPQWESVRSNASLVFDENELRNALGDRPVFDLIDFQGGTEAVTAVYPEGKLLIVEYTNPQSSVDADSKITGRLRDLTGATPIYYRRVGNYNVFMFDSPDEATANVVLDQVKYQKVVQWLGEDPYMVKKLERYFVSTTRDIFIATVLWICLGLVSSILIGIGAGFIFYRFREKRRSVRTAFSDAGGLTRLNLDGLSE